MTTVQGIIGEFESNQSMQQKIDQFKCDEPNNIFNKNLVSLVFMTQFITYPTFLHIDKDKFSEYHRKYVNNISFIVAPVMLIELLTLLLIAYFSKDFLIIKSLILLLVIWLTTFFIMIPSHNKISKAFNKKEINLSLINI